MLATIIIFLVLLFLSGFFSGAEIATMSLSRLQIDRMVKQKKRNAEMLAKLKSNPHKLLETILIGNNLVNIGAAAIATKLAIDVFGNVGVGIATGVTTFLVLLFGEIIPKSLAVNHRKAMSLAITPILYGLQWLLTPVIIVIDGISRVFTRMFGEPEPERITEEEVRDIVQASEEDGSLKKREREMIQKVLELDDTSVAEVMTPRLDVYCLEMHRKVGDVIEEVLEKGYSRVPVYNRKMDAMKGIVLVTHLLKAVHEGKQEMSLKALMQKAIFVPESKKTDSVLRDFQRKKRQLGIVVDEHGLFIGVVTVEDVLEELVGEIYDERDKHEDPVKRIDKDVFVIPGKATISDLNGKYNFHIPEKDDYDTLAGFLMKKLGRVPKERDTIDAGHWHYKIEKVRQHRIESVRISKK